MTYTLALLPSPFLGPAAWEPVAAALTRRGHAVIVPSPPGPVPESPSDVLHGFLAALPDDRDIVLVPHSNAGLFVPGLTEHRRVRASVFVDAILPPAAGDLPVAPRGLVDVLRAKAGDDGRLPPWTEWWQEADLDGLFPTTAVRREIEKEQRRIPLAYLEGSISIRRGWDDGAGAYLAFGDTYEDERSRAGERGWPVATMLGGHLHMLFEPEAVAKQILALLAATEPSL